MVLVWSSLKNWNPIICAVNPLTGPGQKQGAPQFCGGLHPQPGAPTPLSAISRESSRTHVPDLEVLPHEEVQGGTGMGPDGANAAAAVPQEPQAQVCTLLCLLFKQQLRELENSRGGNWNRQE